MSGDDQLQREHLFLTFTAQQDYLQTHEIIEILDYQTKRNRAHLPICWDCTLTHHMDLNVPWRETNLISVFPHGKMKAHRGAANYPNLSKKAMTDFGLVTELSVWYLLKMPLRCVLVSAIHHLITKPTVLCIKINKSQSSALYSIYCPQTLLLCFLYAFSPPFQVSISRGLLFPWIG